MSTGAEKRRKCYPYTEESSQMQRMRWSWMLVVGVLVLGMPAISRAAASLPILPISA